MQERQTQRSGLRCTLEVFKIKTKNNTINPPADKTSFSSARASPVVTTGAVVVSGTHGKWGTAGTDRDRRHDPSAAERL